MTTFMCMSICVRSEVLILEEDLEKISEKITLYAFLLVHSSYLLQVACFLYGTCVKIDYSTCRSYNTVLYSTTSTPGYDISFHRNKISQFRL